MVCIIHCTFGERMLEIWCTQNMHRRIICGMGVFFFFQSLIRIHTEIHKINKNNDASGSSRYYEFMLLPILPSSMWTNLPYYAIQCIHCINIYKNLSIGNSITNLCSRMYAFFIVVGRLLLAVMPPSLSCSRCCW